MRILLLLVVLAVVGLTLARWLGQSPPTARAPSPDSTAAPAVPTRPQELKSFEQDLDRFMQDAASQRHREADPP
jgi:flagellar basal body-associated protein FliL